MDNTKVKDLTAYNNRFHEDPTSFNDYQAADYVKELKNQGKNDEAIEVGRTFLQTAPELTRYINHYGYALYNRYINIDDEQISEKENLFYSILDEIAQVCKQERFSPLEASVNKAIKYVSRKTPVDYEKLSELLDYLDAPTLDDAPFINKEGREYESKKEKWYRLKVKSLYETKKYKDCLEQANIALTLPLKWHYSNLNWIKYYRAASLLELERYEEAENEFLSLQNRFRAVDSGDVLYKLYINTNRENDAYTYLIYDFFNNGFDDSQIDNYKNLLKMTQDKKQERAEALLASMIRKLDVEVESDVDTSLYDDLSADSLFDRVYTEIMEHLDQYINRYEGKVVYYNQNREFGSIALDEPIGDDDRLFFRQADYIYDEEVERFDVVNYSVIKTYDNRHNRPTYRAILLKTLYNDRRYD